MTIKVFTVAEMVAAVLGGYLHGVAGELAAETFGDAGMLAGELADWIPMARQRILEI